MTLTMLTPLVGTSFYEFPAISDLVAFKDLFRDRLSALPVHGAEDIIMEARTAFELTGRIFEDHAETPLGPHTASPSPLVFAETKGSLESYEAQDRGLERDSGLVARILGALRLGGV